MLFIQRRHTISDLSIRTSFQTNALPPPFSLLHTRTLPKNSTLARNETPSKIDHAATSAAEPATVEVPVVEPVVEALE